MPSPMLGYRSGRKNSRCYSTPSFVEERFGWGGRIRTFTVLINSEVSYQLDHAPAGAARKGERRALVMTSRKNGHEVST